MEAAELFLQGRVPCKAADLITKAVADAKKRGGGEVKMGSYGVESATQISSPTGVSGIVFSAELLRKIAEELLSLSMPERCAEIFEILGESIKALELYR